MFLMTKYVGQKKLKNLNRPKQNMKVTWAITVIQQIFGIEEQQWCYGLHHGSIAMNFKLNYDDAWKACLDLTRTPGNESKVIEVIKGAGEHVYENYDHYVDKKKYKKLDTFFKVAIYIKEPTEAFDLLGHFKWEVLSVENIASLALLQKKYGSALCLKLLKCWKNKKEFGESFGVLDDIEKLIATFIEQGGDFQIAAFILDTQTNVIMRMDSDSARQDRLGKIKRDAHERLVLLENILSACAQISDVKLLNKLLAHVISLPMLYTETHLADLLLKMKDKTTIDSTYFAHYKPLTTYITASINKQLAMGIRAENDWSIMSTLSCQCVHCKTVVQFLHANEVTKVWPIVAHIREHVMDVFADSALPVTLSVEKKGSPHKLILSKTPALHRHAREHYDALKQYREKLALCFESVAL